MELRDLLRFGTGVTLARVAAYLGGNADNIVVGRFLGLSALGFYGRAYGLMSSAETLTGGIVDKVFFPAISRVQGDQGRLRKGYHDGQSAIALSALPISALLVVLAPEAILVLLGDGWRTVIPLFQILAAGLLFQTGYGIAMSVIRATGAVYRLARIQIVYAAGVTTGALIGQFWGLQGVAFGILTAMVAGYIVAGRTAMRITGFGWRDLYEMHEPGLRIALVVGSLCWVIADGLRWLNVPAVGIIAAGILVLSLALLLLARKTIAQLLGLDPITELRGVIAKRRSAQSL
jgi:PST family polysaccharide transporter